MREVAQIKSVISKRSNIIVNGYRRGKADTTKWKSSMKEGQ